MNKSKNVVPPKPPSLGHARKWTVGEAILGILFVSLLVSGLFLIAVNSPIVEHQMLVGFALVLVSSIPGWIYYRLRREVRVDSKSFLQAMGNENVVHANARKAKPPSERNLPVAIPPDKK